MSEVTYKDRRTLEADETRPFKPYYMGNGGQFTPEAAESSLRAVSYEQAESSVEHNLQRNVPPVPKDGDE